jgi:CRP-like cAMP-binding protein
METRPKANCDSCPSSTACPAYRVGIIESAEAAETRTTTHHASGEIIRQNNLAPKIMIVRDGWVAKYVLFPDGRRQIIDVLLPGDMATCEELVSPGTSSPMVALSEAELCLFDREAFLGVMSRRPTTMMALWRICANQVTRLRDLLATLGKQSAEARVAAFILSLYARLADLKRASDDEMPFHFRQKDLADVLGLTQVHISRMLKLLKEKNVIDFCGDRIKLLDHPALRHICQA